MTREFILEMFDYHVHCSEREFFELWEKAIREPESQELIHPIYGVVRWAYDMEISGAPQVFLEYDRKYWYEPQDWHGLEKILSEFVRSTIEPESDVKIICQGFSRGDRWGYWVSSKNIWPIISKMIPSHYELLGDLLIYTEDLLLDEFMDKAVASIFKQSNTDPLYKWLLECFDLKNDPTEYIQEQYGN